MKTNKSFLIALFIILLFLILIINIPSVTAFCRCDGKTLIECRSTGVGPFRHLSCAKIKVCDSYWTDEKRCSSTYMVQRKQMTGSCNAGSCRCDYKAEWMNYHDCKQESSRGWTNEYRCDGNTRQRKYRDRVCKGSGTCQDEYSWKDYENCGSSGWTSNYRCSGSILQREYKNKGCSGSSCYSNSEWKTLQDCGSLEQYGDWTANYCKDNDIYHKRTYHKKGCSGNSCYDNTGEEEVKVSECGDSSCGNFGTNYCKEGDLYRNRTCYGKGCRNSTCFGPDSYIEEVIVTDCPVTCYDNACKTMMLASAYWADMRNNNISTTDVNDAVKLVAEFLGAEGQTASFSISELGLIDCTGNWPVSDKQLTAVVSQGKAIAIWRAKLCSNGQSDGVRFTATLGMSKQSSVLAINTQENNAVPTSIIANPLNNAKFAKNQNINFTQASYDVDDDISILWSFGDGINETKTNCSTGGNCNSIHSYSTNGRKTVTLTATDLRGLSNTAVIQIDVLQEGINIIPVISEPLPGSIIEGTVWVYFRANESYTAECTTGACTGNCFSVGNLNCKYLPKENMTFNWIFDDGETRTGTWQNNYNTVVVFNKLFSVPGRHYAQLNVSY